MSDRVRDLLDRAAGEVRPREPDPVAAVLGRVRAARRRRAAAVGVAVVAACSLAVGAVVAGPVLSGPERVDDPATRASATGPAPTAKPLTGPATVTVENGVVRAGGLRMPLPAGWSVATGDQAICDVAPRTVIIDGSAIPGGPCDGTQPMISVRGAVVLWEPERGRAGLSRQLLLPGGQPAWLTSADLDALQETTASDRRLATVYVPWSGVVISFTLPGNDLRQVFASISTEPVATGPLVLPEAADQIMITDETPGRQPVRIKDPEEVGKIRAELAGLSTVPPEAGCPPDTRRLRVTFLEAGYKVLAIVLVGVPKGCGEATSSLGGRVTATAGIWTSLNQRVSR